MFTLRRPLDEKPEVDFIVNGQGVTVYSGRFFEPRFLEWDIKGKCPKCKSSNVDIDFFVTGNGIELHSSRFYCERVVLFDLPYKLPDKCHFRVRMKGQTYTIPYERYPDKGTAGKGEIQNEAKRIEETASKEEGSGKPIKEEPISDENPKMEQSEEGADLKEKEKEEKDSEMKDDKDTN